MEETSIQSTALLTDIFQGLSSNTFTSRQGSKSDPFYKPEEGNRKTLKQKDMNLNLNLNPEPDKILRFEYCFGINMLAGLSAMAFNLNYLIGTYVTLIIISCKSIYDYFKHTANWKDLLYDFLGVTVATLVLTYFHFILNL